MHDVIIILRAAPRHWPCQAHNLARSSASASLQGLLSEPHLLLCSHPGPWEESYLLSLAQTSGSDSVRPEARASLVAHRKTQLQPRVQVMVDLQTAMTHCQHSIGAALGEATQRLQAVNKLHMQGLSAGRPRAVVYAEMQVHLKRYAPRCVITQHYKVTAFEQVLQYLSTVLQQLTRCLAISLQRLWSVLPTSRSLLLDPAR